MRSHIYALAQRADFPIGICLRGLSIVYYILVQNVPRWILLVWLLLTSLKLSSRIGLKTLLLCPLYLHLPEEWAFLTDPKIPTSLRSDYPFVEKPVRLPRTGLLNSQLGRLVRALLWARSFGGASQIKDLSPAFSERFLLTAGTPLFVLQMLLVPVPVPSTAVPLPVLITDIEHLSFAQGRFRKLWRSLDSRSCGVSSVSQ